MDHFVNADQTIDVLPELKKISITTQLAKLSKSQSLDDLLSVLLAFGYIDQMGNSIEALEADTSSRFSHQFPESSSQPSEDFMFTPCTYCNFHTDNVSITSEHYQYANNVQGTAICSHPQIIARHNSEAVPYCSYMHNHSECSLYSSVVDLISTATVSVINTSRKEEFRLTYSPLINFFENQHAHVFTIINSQTAVVVNQMMLSSHEFDFDAAKRSAQNIFDEYISSFSDQEVNISNDSLSIAIGEQPSVSTPIPYFSQVLSFS